ncbi:hypothetical protein, partial [Klebsiella pneumoniae]|uniref:hypothetical protein n=1 Tax=Klebsiella pneumoniae TaxID=573 RepID=UPI0040556092
MPGDFSSVLGSYWGCIISSGDMSWANEKIFDFVNAIHIRPELWDVEHANYRNRFVKKDGWEAVAAELSQ